MTDVIFSPDYAINRAPFDCWAVGFTNKKSNDEEEASVCVPSVRRSVGLLTN